MINVILDIAESVIGYVQFGWFTSVYKYLLVIFGVSPRVMKLHAKSIHFSVARFMALPQGKR